MKLTWRLRLLFMTMATLLVGCDHATKRWAADTLRHTPLELVPQVLDLRYTENNGMAFSIMAEAHAGRTLLLVLTSALATAIVIGAWLWRSRTPVQQAGYALIVSGAIGNLIDRALRGYVVDFIHVHHWPIFNVADVCIVAGAILLVWRAVAARDPARS